MKNLDVNKISKNKNKQQEFRYGNYHQYYGYRNQGDIDPRLFLMKQEWFNNKDVLDIGCNSGHFTLAVAKDFSPKAIVGIDIDGDLVQMASKNVRHYLTYEHIYDDSFPISLPLVYGPIAQTLDPKGKFETATFPYNIQFIQGNYILSSDSEVEQQEAYFDTVLCLSLTKWVHLNWGDQGIKRLFKRIFNHLRPGGNLILEFQTFESYAKKKNITEEIAKNYRQIKLFPKDFINYLLDEIRFKDCVLIDRPAHSSKGFSRPLYVFTKPGGPTRKFY